MRMKRHKINSYDNDHRPPITTTDHDHRSRAVSSTKIKHPHGSVLGLNLDLYLVAYCTIGTTQQPTKLQLLCWFCRTTTATATTTTRQSTHTHTHTHTHIRSSNKRLCIKHDSKTYRDSTEAPAFWHEPCATGERYHSTTWDTSRSCGSPLPDESKCSRPTRAPVANAQTNTMC
jgi:hypothetical protein